MACGYSQSYSLDRVQSRAVIENSSTPSDKSEYKSAENSASKCKSFSFAHYVSSLAAKYFISMVVCKSKKKRKKKKIKALVKQCEGYDLKQQSRCFSCLMGGHFVYLHLLHVMNIPQGFHVLLSEAPDQNTEPSPAARLFQTTS